jgi:hypothetical protein
MGSIGGRLLDEVSDYRFLKTDLLAWSLFPAEVDTDLNGTVLWNDSDAIYRLQHGRTRLIDRVTHSDAPWRLRV